MNNILSETESTAGGSWWDSTMAAFKNDWWVFFVVLAVVLVVLLVIWIFSHGKVLKLKTIIKIGLNCVLGFFLIFLINTVGGLFTAGAFTLSLKWYSWFFVGIFGLLGVIFLIVAMIVWPGVFTIVT